MTGDQRQSPLTYDRIEEELRKTMRREEELVEEFALAVHARARAEDAYKTGIARARVQYRVSQAEAGLKATDQMTADHAQVQVETEFADYLLADAQEQATKQALYSIRSRGEKLQSLMASYRQAAG